MELIDVDGLAHALDDRTVVVAHSQTSLTRGLEFGETVVLRTDGDHFAAKVRAIAFEPEDTVYTLDLGARLPEDLARERVEGLDPTRHDLGLHEVADLLGDLRGRGDHPGPTTDHSTRLPAAV